MLNIIVFSKDRACQLDLLIRSFNEFFKVKDYKLTVFYKYSTESYMEGYKKLFHKHYFINIKEQFDFKEGLKELVDDSAYTMFLVDDLVFIDTVDDNIFNPLKNQEILTTSLRLGRDVSFNYSLQRLIKQPDFVEDFGGLVWDWKHLSKSYRDWMYPMSVDGNIFRTKDLKPFLDLNYYNPNTFEGTMAKRSIKSRSYMFCFNNSKVVNMAVNKVQDTYNNRHGKTSASFLNAKWLCNNRIKLLPLVEHKYNSCHSEAEFELEVFS